MKLEGNALIDLACSATPLCPAQHHDCGPVFDFVVGEVAALLEALGVTQEVHVVRGGTPLLGQDGLQFVNPGTGSHLQCYCLLLKNVLFVVEGPPDKDLVYLQLLFLLFSWLPYPRKAPRSNNR